MKTGNAAANLINTFVIKTIIGESGATRFYKLFFYTRGLETLSLSLVDHSSLFFLESEMTHTRAYITLKKLFSTSITWKITSKCPTKLWEPKLRNNNKPAVARLLMRVKSKWNWLLSTQAKKNLLGLRSKQQHSGVDHDWCERANTIGGRTHTYQSRFLEWSLLSNFTTMPVGWWCGRCELTFLRLFSQAQVNLILSSYTILNIDRRISIKGIDIHAEWSERQKKKVNCRDQTKQTKVLRVE